MSAASTQESTLKAILQDLKQFEENFPDMKSTAHSCALPSLHHLQSNSYLAHNSFPQLEWNENVVHFDSRQGRLFPPSCDDNFHQDDVIGQNLSESFNHNDNFTTTTTATTSLRQQHFHATPIATNFEKTNPSSSNMLESNNNNNNNSKNNNITSNNDFKLGTQVATKHSYLQFFEDIKREKNKSLF